MAKYFDVHPDNPQPRTIGQIAAAIRDDALIAYPTDSCYALGCRLGSRTGIDRSAPSASWTTGTTSPWSAVTSHSSASSYGSTTTSSAR